MAARTSDQRPEIDRRWWGREAVLGLWMPVAGGALVANLATPGVDEMTLNATRGNNHGSGPWGPYAADNVAVSAGASYDSPTLSSQLRAVYGVPPITFIWFGAVFGAPTGTFTRLLGIETPASDNDWLEIQRNNSTQVNVVYDSGGASVELISTTGFATGHNQSVAMVLSSGGGVSYYNGIAGATSATAVSTSNSGTQTIRIGRAGSSNTTSMSNTGMLAGLLMNRALTATEVRILHDDPSQMWVEVWRLPRRTVFAPATTSFTGTAAWTEDPDTCAATGTFTTTGTSAWTEAADTIAASGVTAAFVGTSAWTENADTIAATGTFTTTGTSSWTEAADTIAASGTFTAAGFTGTSAWTEASDTCVASGTFTPAPVTGTSAWTEAADTCVATGTSAALLNQIGNLVIINTKPHALAVTDTKPHTLAVTDTKPHALTVIDQIG